MQAHGLQPPPSVLRADSSLPEQPGSAKMVSLDLLLGAGAANSTPATPRDADTLLQVAAPVDHSDPLVQQLVQDRAFMTAVQTSQLHAAAGTAVRLLRSQLSGGGEFKRPADRRSTPRDALGLESLDATPRAGAGLPALNGLNGLSVRGPGSLVVQRQVVDPRHREALRCMRLEVLQLEDVIPWNSVRRTWKTKRTSWRRQVKQTEVLADFATRLKELRAALLTEEVPLPACGGGWRAQLDACIQGKGSYGLLTSAWEEMRSTIRNWLDGRTKPTAASAAQLQAGAVRAVRAMQAALASASPSGCGGGGGLSPDAGGDGSDEAGDAALLQVPLEGIVGGDSGAALHAVRHAIELEQRILGARLAGAGAAGASPQQPQMSDGSGGDAQQAAAAGQQQQQGAPLVSYFSSISAAWGDSDFDSGADTADPMQQGASSDTDLDSDYDP